MLVCHTMKSCGSGVSVKKRKQKQENMSNKLFLLGIDKYEKKPLNSCVKDVNDFKKILLEKYLNYVIPHVLTKLGIVSIPLSKEEDIYRKSCMPLEVRKRKDFTEKVTAAVYEFVLLDFGKKLSETFDDEVKSLLDKLYEELFFNEVVKQIMGEMYEDMRKELKMEKIDLETLVDVIFPKCEEKFDIKIENAIKDQMRSQILSFIENQLIHEEGILTYTSKRFVQNKLPSERKVDEVYDQIPASSI